MGGHHHHAFFDPYYQIDSPIHALPALPKVITALAVILLTLTLPLNPITLTTAYPLIFLLLIATAGLSLIPPNYILRRLLLTEPFVLGVAALTLFQPHGPRLFATLVLRSTFCIATMLLLANTTPFSDLLEVLKRLKLPHLLITTIALMYRYLFVLTEESTRLRRARACRSFTPSRSRAWTDLATTIAQLFIRTTARADRIYAAMTARGWK